MKLDMGRNPEDVAGGEMVVGEEVKKVPFQISLSREHVNNLRRYVEEARVFVKANKSTRSPEIKLQVERKARVLVWQEALDAAPLGFRINIKQSPFGIAVNNVASVERYEDLIKGFFRNEKRRYLSEASEVRSALKEGHEVILNLEPQPES